MPDPLLNRFLHAFDGVVPGETAADLWAALHGDSVGGQALTFGVTEMSISLRPGTGPALRWLAETTERRPLSPESAGAALELGRRLLAVVGAPAENRALLDELWGCAFGRFEESERPPFRLGYALEFTPDRPPGVKWYAEPRAAGPRHAEWRLATMVRSLGLEKHLAVAREMLRTTVPWAVARGVGVDLAPGSSPNLKVYFTVRSCPWDRLAALDEGAAGQVGRRCLEAFHRLVLRGREHIPPNGVLLAVVLSPLLPAGRPLFKWDAYLPQFHTSDGLVRSRLLALCRELGLSDEPYRALWTVVAGSYGPRDTVNLHQYASLDLSAAGEPKLNVYLRPLHGSTVHMPPARRPILLRQTTSPAAVPVAIQRGLVFLADRCHAGDPEIVHRMRFPRAAGFQTDQIHQGDVYQRATLCRTLTLAGARFDVDPSLVAAELEALIARQDPDSGGWKYFPSLEELPPDADDVAQVLLAFLENGDGRTPSLFSRIFDRIGRLAAFHGGAMPTWLVEPDRRPADPHHQAVARWWGQGADAEVVANLAYALWRADRERFGPWVTKACNWVASRQDADGGWSSTWYWGRGYGTWMAVRLLGTVRPLHPALHRAAAWVSRATVAPSGKGRLPAHPSGPGQETLETALALCTGAVLYQAGLLRAGSALLRQLAERLVTRQTLDGGWSAEPLIRMDLYRAAVQRGTASPRYRSHGSRPLTTAFTLQALLTLEAAVRASSGAEPDSLDADELQSAPGGSRF